MQEKPLVQNEEGARSSADEAPPRKDEEFRSLCRRYSRLQARMPR